VVILKKADWDLYTKWDKKYHLRILSSNEEFKPICIDRVEGSYVFTEKGDKILDMLSGWICTNVGQRHFKVVEAIKKALENYGWVPENYVTPYLAELSKIIVEDLMGPDSWAGKARFLTSGSEAIEESIVIAKLYKRRPNIVSVQHSYHGHTMGAAGCVGIKKNRSSLASPVRDEVIDVPGYPPPGYFYIPAPFCYRCPIGHNYPDCKKGGELACVHASEEIIETIGPESISAMVQEVQIGGSTIVPPPEYIPQIYKLAKKFDMLFIDDEVMCGFGRTGKWFGYQHYDIKPDIVAAAKGIVSAQLPVAAVIVGKNISDFFDEYRWQHYATFGGHPLCLAAAVANLKVMVEEKILENVEKMGKYLGEKLRGVEERHRSVGYVNGMGLFWGVELVRNKRTREPFIKSDRFARYTGDISNYPVNIIQSKCLEKGVLYSGFVPNTLRIAPPLNTNEEDLDTAIEALEYGLNFVDDKCDRL